MTVAITVFATSLVFNVYYFRINHLLESSKNSAEANSEAFKVSTEELVRMQIVLAMQHNSDSGEVKGESLTKLQQIIYDMPQVMGNLDFKGSAGRRLFHPWNTSDEIERIQLETDAGIAVLNGARLQTLSYADFIASDNQERLFNVSFVGDKVVLLEEKYRP